MLLGKNHVDRHIRKLSQIKNISDYTRIYLIMLFYRNIIINLFAVNTGMSVEITFSGHCFSLWPSHLLRSNGSPAGSVMPFCFLSTSLSSILLHIISLYIFFPKEHWSKNRFTDDLIHPSTAVCINCLLCHH